MFCVKCGEKAEKGYFCSTCFLDQHELFKLDNFELNVCRRCNCVDDVEIKNVEKFVKNEIKKRVFNKFPNVKKVDTVCKIAGNRYESLVKCTGFIEDCESEKVEEKKVQVIVRTRLCDNCVKISGNYHEAVIYVSGKRREELVRMIINIIESNNIKLAASEDEKEHYTMKFLSKKDAKFVREEIRGKADVDDSYKLVGLKKGVKLYRNFYRVT